MGLTIYQINIQSWEKKKYILECELASIQPDIILLNEISTLPKGMKLRNYYSMPNEIGPHSGTAILVKMGITLSPIELVNEHIQAIKIKTTYGDAIISTAYIAPTNPLIPTIEINKLLSYNLPLLIIGDFNAHHPILNNVTPSRPTDNKGRTLTALINKKNLCYLGPPFYTFVTNRAKGRPDVILCNNKFKIFHYQIDRGNSIGSDHVPIIFKMSIKPFREVRQAKLNIKSLNITAYQDQLKTLEINTLNHKSLAEIDNVTKSITDTIQKATAENCKLTTSITIQSYQPTPRIKRKLQQFQAANLNHVLYSVPPTNYLSTLRDELVNLVIQDKNSKWEEIVKLATQKYGKPFEFWKSVKYLQGKPPKTKKPLISSYTVEDSEESDFGEEISEKITDPQQQANLISTSWETIYHPHRGEQFENENTTKIEQWYASIKDQLNPDAFINLNNLKEDHPLLRPVTTLEVAKAIQFTNPHKAPGLSSITAYQLKYLPANIRLGLKHLYDAMLASKYFPQLLLKIKMIFFGKPNADTTDPLNYRPISLIETICKIFEKIMTSRFSYFLEHHNLLSESQFGFRKRRSTQQVITMVCETLKENKKQKRTSLVATRDISKAFDTIWHEGLLYKLYHITNECIEFTALISHYLMNRTVIPYFNNHSGQSFTPQAGVPQGSVLGPVLFLVYVNDIPPPIYHDTIRTQFADDVVTVVRSDTKGKAKIPNGMKKLNFELNNILEWENKWKIKVNPAKSTVGTASINITQMELNGGININNSPLLITNTIKILGHQYNFSNNSTSHISNIIPKAKLNLGKLYRFKSAPPKIKRHLYLALIRPLLEYPSTQIAASGITNIKKLQRIQNKAIRFITNTRLREMKTCKDLHEQIKLDPMNIRLNKLKVKQLHKIQATYCPKDDLWPPTYDSLGEYEIKEPALCPKNTTLAQRIMENIFQKHQDCPWFNPVEPPDREDPNPIYT